MGDNTMATDRGESPEIRSGRSIGGDGPGIVVFGNRSRWLAVGKKIFQVLVFGSYDNRAFDDSDPSGRSTIKSRYLSSIEVDPENAADDPNRPSTSGATTAAPGGRRPSSIGGQFGRCLTLKGYAFLVTCIELLGLLYLMTTSVVIYTRDHMWAWYFQPFVAPLWFRHPTALFATTCTFCSAGLFGVVCLMQAMDERKRVAAKLLLPHLLLQMLTMIGSSISTLIAVVLLMTKGTFALRIVELAGSSLANGLVGVGNIFYGLEHGRAQRWAAEAILKSAGIVFTTPGPPSAVNGTTAMTIGRLITSTHASPSSSVIRYNMIGAIWGAFNYEIAMVVAFLVFGTICLTQIFAWLLIRQLYAASVLKENRRKKSDNVRSRRRYESGATSV